MNKKGTTITWWISGLLLLVLFIFAINVIITSMNQKYDKSFSSGFETNATRNLLTSYQANITDKISGGQAEMTSTGELSVKSSWSVLKEGFSIFGKIVGGTWIRTIVGYMNLGEMGDAVATTFQAIYIIAFGFAILAAIFKWVI